MDIETWIGQAMPPAYASYLSSHESDQAIGDVTLYGPADLVEMNETYEVKEYCEGHITIGDDGGGMAIVLRLSDGSLHIVGHGSMTPEWMTPVAECFATWLSAGCPLPQDC